MGRGARQPTSQQPSASAPRHGASSHWKLHPKISEQQLRDHLAAVLDGQWESPERLRLRDGASVQMGFAAPLEGELRNPSWACLALEYFGVEPRRSGLGTRFIEALRDFSDETGYRLLIADIIDNPSFWSRFGWLESQYTEADDQLTYHPNLLAVHQRRSQRASRQVAADT